MLGVESDGGLWNQDHVLPRDVLLPRHVVVHVQASRVYDLPRVPSTLSIPVPLIKESIHGKAHAVDHR
jgi:hypothetical protein